jgi:hypothetical protein
VPVIEFFSQWFVGADIAAMDPDTARSTLVSVAESIKAYFDTDGILNLVPGFIAVFDKCLRADRFPVVMTGALAFSILRGSSDALNALVHNWAAGLESEQQDSNPLPAQLLKVGKDELFDKVKPLFDDWLTKDTAFLLFEAALAPSVPRKHREIVFRMIVQESLRDPEALVNAIYHPQGVTGEDDNHFAYWSAWASVVHQAPESEITAQLKEQVFDKLLEVVFQRQNEDPERPSPGFFSFMQNLCTTFGCPDCFPWVGRYHEWLMGQFGEYGADVLVDDVLRFFCWVVRYVFDEFRKTGDDQNPYCDIFLENLRELVDCFTGRPHVSADAVRLIGYSLFLGAMGEQTIKGDIDNFYFPDDQPISGIERLWDAFVGLQEGDDLITEISRYVLRFYAFHSPDAATHALFSALRGYLEDTQVGLKTLRVLQILYIWLTEAEAGLDTVDFPQRCPRHNPKQPREVWRFHIQPEPNKEIYDIDIDPDTYLTVLIQRLAIRHEVIQAHVVAKVNQRPIAPKAPGGRQQIRRVLTNGSLITLELTREPRMTRECASIWLWEQGIVRMILRIGEAEPESEQEAEAIRTAAWKLMQWFPTDPDIVREVENPSPDVELLNGQRNDLMLAYVLQILEMRPPDRRGALDRLIDDPPFWSEMLDRLEGFLHSMPGILWLLTEYFEQVNRLLPDLENRLLTFLITALTQIRVLKVRVVRRVTRLLERFSEGPTDIIARFEAPISAAIASADAERWECLSHWFASITNSEQLDRLGRICLFDLESSSPYFAALLSSVFEHWRVSQDCYVGEILFAAARTASGIKFDSIVDVLLKLNNAAYARGLTELALFHSTSRLTTRIFEHVAAVEGPVKSELVDYLITQCDTKLDAWDYDPAKHMKSEFGIVGLPNLGATCYVNAVLQQLANTPQFLGLLFDRAGPRETPELIELRQILARLVASDLPMVDPRPFIERWSSATFRLIRLGEQRDAGDFFTALVNGLPDEMRAPFKGQFSVTLYSADDSEGQSQHLEDFFLLHLPVDGMTDINMSLNSLSHAQPLGEGRRRLQRIVGAPSVLVVQLDRLLSESTADGPCLRKLPSYFRYDERINLRKLLVAGKDVVYELQGLVCHRGTDEHGHYVSIVRRGMHRVCVSDTIVREYADLGNTYSGLDHRQDDVSWAGEAILLFYSQDTELPEDIPNKLEVLHEALLEDILEENHKFSTLQVLATPDFWNFIEKLDDYNLWLTYFLFVYSHTRLGGEDRWPTLVNYLRDHVGDRVNETIGKISSRWSRVAGTFERAEPVFARATSQFVCAIIATADEEAADRLVGCILDTLKHGAVAPSSVVPILSIIEAAIRRENSAARFLSCERGTHRRLIDWIASYTDEQSVERLKYEDFTVLFTILELLLDCGPSPDDYQRLPEIVPRFKQAHQNSKSAFGHLMTELQYKLGVTVPSPLVSPA